MRFGDIYWADLPDRNGREQRGRRPVIIWQDIGQFPKLPTVLVIPLTTQLETIRFAATVLIYPATMNGLKYPSVAMVFQLGACDVRRFGTRMGKLSKHDLEKVRAIARKLQKLV